MSTEVEQLRRLLAEEQRARVEERRLHAEDRERISKTNLPTFLDGLHKYLFLDLKVQQETMQPTRGDPANTTNKLRPRKLKAWHSFAKEQEEIWRLLMDSSLVAERLFTSLYTLEEIGERTWQQLDLNRFLRQTLEDIIRELYNDPTLREVLGLRGTIRFKNHSNTLSPEREPEEGIQSMDIRGRPRQRSPRIAAREQSTPSVTATRGPRIPPPVLSSWPHPDQFCVYNIPSESSDSIHRVAAYIKEYKSSREMKLGHVYDALEDMDIDEVVEQKEDENPKVRCRRAIAALLVQPYNYMVRAGTEMGVLSTGETDVYLRIGDEPGTLLYHLSVPKRDVGDSTGWDSHSNGPNRLHLTAMGQSLAFTLQALKLRPRNQAWRQQEINLLPSWGVVVADVLENCEVLGIHGSRGALLKVTLSSHGYTVPTKCTIREFAQQLRHEAAVYDKPRPIQGMYIPLYLGSIDLVHPYSYDGIANLEHMMLLSPGGQPPGLAVKAMSRDSLIAKIKESLSEIHGLNVLHKDPAPRNWLYNPESENVVFFDFERAEIIDPRPTLGMIAPNREQKQGPRDGFDKKLPVTDFAREINKAVQEL
ncbi:hypothetical protein PENDEC_c013G04148 [Penicillium decumbens]|uniref:Protein kinase domain-containing protein n=1 Tax=Penicillium decumbens TaxID=69771 RepID=A0A1V6PA47_PENDC|nr:hypothetical protein PENDEC_c013G04148 [Penicillium decumbens]